MNTLVFPTANYKLMSITRPKNRALSINQEEIALILRVFPRKEEIRCKR